MKIHLMIIALFAFVNLSANIGTVEEVSGRVKVQHANSFKKERIKVGYEILEEDMLMSSNNATAVLKLSDGSSVILGSNATIFFEENKIEQKKGKIYYHITKRDVKNALKIKTPFAIIGIKGTTFVIDASDNGFVALKEGLIGVASIKEEFELYKQKVMQDFQNYKQGEMEAFEKFKSQIQYEAPLKTKEFDLSEGKRVMFKGSDVFENSFHEEDKKIFAEFEKLLHQQQH